MADQPLAPEDDLGAQLLQSGLLGQNGGGTPSQAPQQAQAPAPQANPSGQGVTISEASVPAPPLVPLSGNSPLPYPPDSGAAQRLTGAQEQPLGNPTSFLDAAAGGAAQGIYAAKDFVTGGVTPEGDKSQTRRNIESGVKNLSDQSPVDGLVANVSQLAVGMLGVGKLAAAAKASPVIGDALTGAADALNGTASTSLKAAAAGATFFDPHTENIANVVQSVPALQNPVTQFLASSPDDGDALGRVKNAMASIGLDAAVTGTFAAVLKVAKAVQSGTPEAIQAAHAEIGQAVQDEQTFRSPPQESALPAVTKTEPKNQPLPSRTIAADVPGAVKTGSVDAMRFADAPTTDELDQIMAAGQVHESSEVDRLFGEHAEQVKKLMRSRRDSDAEKLDDLINEHYGYGSEQEGLVYGTNNYNIVNGESLQRLRDQISAVEFALDDAKAGDYRQLNKEIAWLAPKLPAIEKDAKRHTEAERIAILGLAKALSEITSHGLDLEEALRGATEYTADRVNGDFDDAHLLLERLSQHLKGLDQTTTEAPKLNNTGLPKDSTISGEVPSEVRVVNSPTQGAQASGGLPPKAKLIAIPDDQLDAILKKMQEDGDALIQHGSWENAVDAGHTFGLGNGADIPFQKIAQGDPVGNLDALILQSADRFKETYDKLKGGDVITDAMHSQMYLQRVALWNEDPGALIGLLQAAGKQAVQLRANMDASFALAQAFMQRSYQISQQINMGYLEPFNGSRDAALAAFKEAHQVAITAYSMANAMRSNLGRAFRGLRGEFAPSEQDLDAFKAADPELMLKLMQQTGGDPRQMLPLMQPKLWSADWWKANASEFGQFLLINNLVSNPKTHLAILLTNGYQVLSRPLERLMGAGIRSLAQKAGRIEADQESGQIAASAAKQYVYMASSVMDSFRTAAAAFKAGDSIIAPHSVETGASNTSLSHDIAQAEFKPFNSTPNILYNALMFAAKIQGIPTRVVGWQDELVKNVVYRSKVQADAWANARAQGLQGDELNAAVQRALMNAFDAYGRATDLTLLNEAKIATFQQDLLPGTFGAAVQQARNSYRPIGMVLPFVPTPVNLFRNGVKLTPGLDLLQKEFRDAFYGRLGPEQQTQAFGQFAMGSLMMSVTAYLAHQGLVTGSGPSDPRLKQALISSGWKANAFVIPHADGSATYIPYDRYDPIAMPLGMMANLMEAAQHDDPVLDNKKEAMATALFLGFLKSATDKLYLSNFQSMIEAIDDPDRSAWKTGGSFVSNYVPMAAGMREFNPDPYMREAHSFVDQARRGIPGQSQNVPVRRDFTGEPVLAHRGMWQNDSGNVVDREVNRLALEQGLALGNPPPTTRHGVDLRTIQTTDGANAYDRLQELARKPTPDMTPLKEALGKLIGTETYQSAPDGAGNDKGTKAALLMDYVSKYRDAAMKELMADKNVSSAEYKRALATAAAYSAKKSNPTPQNMQSQVLSDLGKAFGVDLHSLAGATGVKPPAPLAGPPVQPGGM